MSVQVQQAQRPHTSFWLNLFHLGQRTAGADPVKEAPITWADWQAMPKEAQLLLAHCLQRDTTELMLLRGDSDASSPLAAGWLRSLPSSTAGMNCYKIKPYVWRRLTAFGSLLLNDDLLADLRAYRRRKSALYPWIWW